MDQTGWGLIPAHSNSCIRFHLQPTEIPARSVPCPSIPFHRDKKNRGSLKKKKIEVQPVELFPSSRKNNRSFPSRARRRRRPDLKATTSTTAARPSILHALSSLDADPLRLRLPIRPRRRSSPLEPAAGADDADLTLLLCRHLPRIIRRLNARGSPFLSPLDGISSSWAIGARKEVELGVGGVPTISSVSLAGDLLILLSRVISSSEPSSSLLKRSLL